MAQTVRFPLEPLAQPRHRHLRALVQTNRTGSLRMGLKPFLEVVREGHKPPLPGLGLVCGHRDKAPFQVDFAPVEALQFRHPQTGKGSQG